MAAEDDSGRTLARVDKHTHDIVFSKVFLELRDVAVFLGNTSHNKHCILWWQTTTNWLCCSIWHHKNSIQYTHSNVLSVTYC